jgi:hypothetical protein
VRSNIASSSASESAAAPFSSSFSRGRSSLGQSLIAMQQLDPQAGCLTSVISGGYARFSVHDNPEQRLGLR